VRPAVHPIEKESYDILRRLVDLSHLPPLSRAVTERVIHATADLSFATDLVLDEKALEAGAAALASGSPIVADVRMVAAGVTTRNVICALQNPGPARGETRAAHGIRLAFEQAGRDAVWVIGCAPTALAELLSLDARPAFVVGLPVGFVGAVEAKAALASAGVPMVTNRSAKGGSAVAAAALNALLYGGEA
jgi:precorrin-8X/cobalt-precorrin-8 methylmutase